jgi:hypothetical protein
MRSTIEAADYTHRRSLAEDESHPQYGWFCLGGRLDV